LSPKAPAQALKIFLGRPAAFPDKSGPTFIASCRGYVGVRAVFAARQGMVSNSLLEKEITLTRRNISFQRMHLRIVL
jgi:hypothetical protein